MPDEIWIRAPGMDERNEVKLEIPCDKRYIGDIRGLALSKLHFGRNVKEGQLVVQTLDGQKLRARMRISDLTEEQDTLIIGVSQEGLAAPVPPPKKAAAAAPAADPAIATGAMEFCGDCGQPVRSFAFCAQTGKPHVAAVSCAPPPRPHPAPPSRAGARAPAPSHPEQHPQGKLHPSILKSPRSPVTPASSGGSVDGSAVAVPSTDNDARPHPACVLYIDRVAPDLADACLRAALQQQVGRVAALEVIRSGVSAEARMEHFASAYAFAYLTEQPRKGFRKSGPQMIDVPHVGNVARLGAGRHTVWPEQVRVQVTAKEREMPKQPVPKLSLHIRVYARRSSEEGGAWSQWLESIEWAGFLALVEATHEKKTSWGPTDYIKVIADEKKSKKNDTHADVIVCGFFVECNSTEDGESLKQAVHDRRVCCNGVTFLLDCEYTVKNKKLYDRCARNIDHRQYYKEISLQYSKAHRKAKDAIQMARTTGLAGLTAIQQLLAKDGGFFKFYDSDDIGRSFRANGEVSLYPGVPRHMATSSRGDYGGYGDPDDITTVGVPQGLPGPLPGTLTMQQLLMQEYQKMLMMLQNPMMAASFPGGASQVPAPPPPSPPPWPPGDATAYTDVGQCVGRGAYGEIALCLRRDGVRVAMKRPTQEPGESPLAELDSEGAALGALSHPNIVSLLDTLKEPCPFAGGALRTTLVMEYADAGDLTMRLKRWAPQRLLRNAMVEQEALPIAADLAEACCHMHRLGVVHRDIKPANIVFSETHRRLDTDGNAYDREEFFGLYGGYEEWGAAPAKHDAKLCDFGVAAFTGPGGEVEASNYIEPPSKAGVPCYLAPELVRQEAHGAPCDLWAVGCVLYQMVTGSAPFFSAEQVRAFAGSSAAQECGAGSSGLLPLPVPASPTAALLDRLIAPRPERRESAEAVACELGRDVEPGESIASTISTTTSSNTSPVRITRPGDSPDALLYGADASVDKIRETSRRERVWSPEQCASIERHIDELVVMREQGKLRPHTFDKADKRVKYFFGFGYTYPGVSRIRTAVEKGEERLLPPEAVDPIPQWVRDEVIKPAAAAGIIESEEWVNMVAINDYDEGGYIVSHVDPPQLFHRPIVTSSFFSESALSYGCRWNSRHFNRPTKPTHREPLERGDVLSCWGYSADRVPHCVRPCDVSGRRVAIILRRVRDDAPRVSDAEWEAQVEARRAASW